MATSAVVVLGAVMSILEATIVNVAISTLGREFATDLSTIQWVSTGYLLALASMISLTGWGRVANAGRPPGRRSPSWPGRPNP